MKKWLYLNVVNKVIRYCNRNAMRTFWMDNYDFKLWESQKPLPLKELLKTRYINIGRSK